MTRILAKGYGRYVSVRVGDKEVPYSEFGGRKLENVIGLFYDALPEEDKRVIYSLNEALKSDAGKVAIKNFARAFQKLYRSEFKERCKVEYVIPLSVTGSFVKIVDANNVVRRGAVAVELGVGVTNPLSEVKRYTNFVIPAVIIIDYDKDYNVKDVTIATNTPGVMYSRIRPNAGMNPILEGLMFLKKPKAENVVTMYIRGKVGPSAYNYFKPDEIWPGKFEFSSGAPINGYYLYGSSSEFEFALVMLGLGVGKDGVKVEAVIKSSSTEGVNEKRVTLTTFKPEEIKAVPCVDIGLLKKVDKNVEIPISYVVTGSSPLGKTIVPFTLDMKDAVILTTAITKMVASGVPFSGASEASVTAISSRVQSKVLDGLVSAKGVNVVKDVVKLDKESLKVFDPTKPVVFPGTYLVLPAVAYYTASVGKITKIRMLFVAFDSKGRIAIYPNTLYYLS